MRLTPTFKTPDAHFEYLVTKMHHRSWDTNPVRHDFDTFVFWYPRLFKPKPKQPFAKFLAAKADALQKAGDTVAIERLRAHIRRSFAGELKRKRPEWLALVAKLSGPQTALSTAYVFKPTGSYDDKRLAKLPAAELKQFLVAGGRYLGGNVRALPALLRKLRADSDGEGVDIQHWYISTKGAKKPTYEMWTFMVDNGTVFRIGSSAPVVEMIQGSFQSRKDNADLAADLQNVVPF